MSVLVSNIRVVVYCKCSWTAPASDEPITSWEHGSCPSSWAGAGFLLVHSLLFYYSWVVLAFCWSSLLPYYRPALPADASGWPHSWN